MVSGICVLFVDFYCQLRMYMAIRMHKRPAITEKVSGSPNAIMPVREAATGSTLARMAAFPLSVWESPFV